MKAKDTFVKQLSRSMTKELVKTHLDLEAWHLRTETLDELFTTKSTLYFFSRSLSASLTKVFLLVPP